MAGRLPTGIGGQSLEPLQGGLGDKTLPFDGAIPMGNARSRTARFGLPRSDSGRVIITPEPFGLDFDVDVDKILGLGDDGSLGPIGISEFSGRHLITLGPADLSTNAICYNNQGLPQRYAGIPLATEVRNGRRFMPTQLIPGTTSGDSFFASGNAMVRPDTHPFGRFRFSLDPWDSPDVIMKILFYGAGNAGLTANTYVINGVGFFYDHGLSCYSSNGNPTGAGEEEVTPLGIIGEDTDHITLDIDMRNDDVAIFSVDDVVVAEHTVIPDSDEPFQYAYTIYNASADPADACIYYVGATEIESG